MAHRLVGDAAWGCCYFSPGDIAWRRTDPSWSASPDVSTAVFRRTGVLCGAAAWRPSGCRGTQTRRWGSPPLKEDGRWEAGLPLPASRFPPTAPLVDLAASTVSPMIGKRLALFIAITSLSQSCRRDSTKPQKMLAHLC